MTVGGRPANVGGFVFGLVAGATSLAFTVYGALAGELFRETRRGLPLVIAGPLCTLLFGFVAVHSWLRSKHDLDESDQ